MSVIQIKANRIRAIHSTRTIEMMVKTTKHSTVFLLIYCVCILCPCIRSVGRSVGWMLGILFALRICSYRIHLFGQNINNNPMIMFNAMNVFRNFKYLRLEKKEKKLLFTEINNNHVLSESSKCFVRIWGKMLRTASFFFFLFVLLSSEWEKNVE